MVEYVNRWKILHLSLFMIVLLNFLTVNKNVALAACDSDSWDCDDGQCISSIALCDGEVDCNDGSDEIAANCVHMNCPRYAFRCAYGACIPRKQCDGQKQCADNSDEMPLLCAPNKRELEQQLQGNCTDNKFMCGSGECIDNESKCDGSLDCVDGSDEKVEICSTMPCPSYAFRCGYGACVRGNSKCDGSRDCADGSDEAALLCGRERERQTPGTVLPIFTTSTTTTTTMRPLLPPPGTSGGFDGHCKVALGRPNLRVQYFNEGVDLHPGATVPVNGIVIYSCTNGNNLEYSASALQNVCLPTGWLSDEPRCTRNCTNNMVTHGFSTLATCYYENNVISCNSDLLRPGTEAQLRCAPGFMKPTGLDQFPDNIQCKEDGQWSELRATCTMECGVKAKTSTPFAKGGNDVDVTDVPWNVGVYNNFNNRDFIHACGGTIISPRLVLSAAHCFWDKANLKVFNANLFRIAAGKYHRDYNSKEETFSVQKRTIQEIIVEAYDDLTAGYLNDVAILVLEQHLKFTESIRPVCLNFPGYEQTHVVSNTNGIFAGWGITDNNQPADRLQSVPASTLSNRACKEKLPADTNLAADKFCLADDGVATACRGDSGGGFVVTERDANNHLKYTLLGIISNAPVKSQDCAKDGIVAVTNVRYFKDFIMKYFKREQRKDKL